MTSERYHAGNPRPMPPIATLREHVAINATSPSGLIWVGRGQKRRVGARAGRRCAHGYWEVRINGATYLAHRVVWALANGECPGRRVVDHADRNPANNAPSNLRAAGQSANCGNAVARVGFSSRYKGVSVTRGRVRAYIRRGQQLHHLGMFRSERDAAAAYNAAAIEMFGEFARLNDLDAPGETYVAGAHREPARAGMSARGVFQ